MNSGFIGWASTAPGNAPYINIQDQKAQNTAGGTFTNGADRTRTLNTVVNNDRGTASLDTSTNRITLPAGKYLCRASAPAFAVNRHQAWLQNITTATTLLRGTSELCAGTNTTTRSMIQGQFELTTSSQLEVQHRCNTTEATNGFGAEANFGVEVYTVVELWKVA